MPMNFHFSHFPYQFAEAGSVKQGAKNEGEDAGARELQQQ